MIANAYEKLPCHLTDREKAQKSAELSREIHRQEQIEADQSDAARSYGARLKESTRKIGELAEQVRTGIEHREVGVVERSDYAAGVVEVIRVDTGEVVRARPLEPHERQREMFPRRAELDGPGEDDEGDESETAATEH